MTDRPTRASFFMSSAAMFRTSDTTERINERGNDEVDVADEAAEDVVDEDADAAMAHSRRQRTRRSMI